MSAPVGNKFWQQRAKHGRDKLFATPELLLEAAEEYFEWCDNNPWYKNEAIKSGELAGEIMKVPTARPYTLSGFWLYVEASDDWWRNFKAGLDTKTDEDFLRVVKFIEHTIYTQKFEGAAVGAFNASIIQRDLGLREATDVTTKGEKINTDPPIINVYQPGTNIPEISEEEPEQD